MAHSTESVRPLPCPHCSNQSNTGQNSSIPSQGSSGPSKACVETPCLNNPGPHWPTLRPVSASVYGLCAYESSVKEAWHPSNQGATLTVPMRCFDLSYALRYLLSCFLSDSAQHPISLGNHLDTGQTRQPQPMAGDLY